MTVTTVVPSSLPRAGLSQGSRMMPGLDSNSVMIVTVHCGMVGTVYFVLLSAA